MANRWSTSVSYSLSKLSGNYDQDYSAGTAIFNTSSLINDGPGSFTADTFRQGVLSQDRTHVFKIFGSYMPLDQLTLGTYIRGQSGTPWEARGLPWGSTATYLRYLEPAGTNRNDFWTNVDLLAAYAIPLGRARFKLEGRILNLFDTQTALSVDQRKYPGWTYPHDRRHAALRLPRVLDGRDGPGDDDAEPVVRPADDLRAGAEVPAQLDR